MILKDVKHAVKSFIDTRASKDPEKKLLIKAEKTVQDFVDKRNEWRTKSIFRELFREEFLTLEKHAGTEKYFDRPSIKQALNLAKKYPSRTQLKWNRGLAYKVLEDNNLVTEIFPEKYSIEECLLMASQYTCEGSFMKSARVAYRILKNSDKLDSIRYKPIPKKVSLEEAIELAKSFKSRSKLREHNDNAYQKLRAQKLLDSLYPDSIDGKMDSWNTARLTLEKVKGYCEGRGDIKCVDTIYINAQTHMKFQCTKCKKPFVAMFQNIKSHNSGCQNRKCTNSNLQFRGHWSNGNKEIIKRIKKSRKR